MGSEQLDHSSQFRNGAYAQFAVFFPTRAGQLGSRGNALRAGWDGSDPEKFMDNEEHVGMETCTHGDSSFIDLQTLQKSGPLPLAFLRGIGLSDDLIACLPSLLNQQPLKS